MFTRKISSLISQSSNPVGSCVAWCLSFSIVAVVAPVWTVDAQVPSNYVVVREVSVPGSELLVADLSNSGDVAARADFENGSSKTIVSTPNRTYVSPASFDPRAIAENGFVAGSAFINGRQTGALYRFRSGNGASAFQQLLPFGTDSFGSITVDVNSRGVAVGYSNLRTFTGYIRATKWVNGSPSLLPAPGECNETHAINDAGQITGSYSLPGEHCFPLRGFLLSNGLATPIILEGYAFTYPGTITSDGTVLGCAGNRGDGGGGRAFLYRNGYATDLGEFAYPGSCAVGKAGELVAVNSWGDDFEDEPTIMDLRSGEKAALSTLLGGAFDPIQIVTMNEQGLILVTVREPDQSVRSLVVAPAD